MYKRTCRKRRYISRSTDMTQTHSPITMKSIIIVAFAFAAVAVAAPADPIKILRSSSDVDPDGTYKFDFETDNGITRNEKGELKQVLDAENKPHEVLVMRGSWSYIGPNGEKEVIEFFADEFGYHPSGPSIPQPARR